MRCAWQFMAVAGVVISALPAGRNILATPSQKAAASSVQSLQNEVIARERQELEALKNGKVQEFADLMAENAIFVDSHGTAGKAEVMGLINDLKLVDYSMADIKFVPVSPDSGVIAYKLTQKGREHGKDFADTVYASALWVKRSGKWVCLFTQESPAQ